MIKSKFIKPKNYKKVDCGITCGEPYSIYGYCSKKECMYYEKHVLPELNNDIGFIPRRK